MRDQAGAMILRLHIPELLQPDAVHLGIGASAQRELRLELPAELAAAAFREERVLAMQFHAGLVGRCFFIFFINTKITGCDALDRAAFVENFGSGESRED